MVEASTIIAIPVMAIKPGRLLNKITPDSTLNTISGKPNMPATLVSISISPNDRSDANIDVRASAHK
jgi:hypothetical protein